MLRGTHSGAAGADELWAHIIPTAITCRFRRSLYCTVKTPAAEITCDSSLAGMPPGQHREGPEFEFKNGKVCVAGTSTWPAPSFTDLCVGNVIRFAGVSLARPWTWREPGHASYALCRPSP